MLDTRKYGDYLKEKGFSFFTGTPCSFLKYLINYGINNTGFVMAANEGDALAIASGAYLGGSKPVVMMQNSGLTNAVSPLTSLNHIFKIPVLGFVSLRGEPGLKDEPQHELMGVITGQLLTDMDIPWEYLSTDEVISREQLDRADKVISTGKSFFFVVKKGTFSEVTIKAEILSSKSNPGAIIADSTGNSDRNPDSLPSRLDVLSSIKAEVDSSTVVIISTGKGGRELFELGDMDNNFYMVGSMGCASSIGLGLSLVKPKAKVIVVDGDGAVLMRLGSLATNAFYNPSNLIHILLDNETHDSTGGQFTVSPVVDFPQVASACGYPVVGVSETAEGLRSAIVEWKNSPSLTFHSIKIKKGSKKDLGRPTVKPFQVTERLVRFIGRIK